MTCDDLPPYQVWFITMWVAFVGGGLGYSSSRAPLGINAHTLVFVVFLVLLFCNVQLAYQRGLKRSEE